MSDVLEVPVGDVKVGDRVRKELRHVEMLAESIRDVGLLHPLVVNGRMELVAGARRLEAVKRCGWERVPVRVVASLDDALKALVAERDENTCREHLTPTELVELGRQIEALEKPAAKQRQGARTDLEHGGKLPQSSAGKTRDKVAAALGVGSKTYEKAEQVVVAAEEDPEAFGDLPELMNKKSVDAAHRLLKKRGGGPKPRAGKKAGKAPAPEHPYQKLLTACQSLSGAVTKAIDGEAGEYLRGLLLAVSKKPFAIPMLSFTSDVIENGEVNRGRCRFVGLQPLRGLFRLAGAGKKMTAAETAKAFAELCGRAETEDEA